jgi:sec-independent protein translocase protein TatA
MSPLLAIFEGGISLTHWIIFLAIGVLFFGKRLPEVGRYLGKGIVEFKKGLKGLEDEMGDVQSPSRPQEPSASLEPPRPPTRIVTNVPKFEDTPQNITPPPAPPSPPAV